MTRISTIGRSTKGLPVTGRKAASQSGAKGMTFIEVVLVVSILSAILLIAFPRIPHLSDYTLKNDARKLAGLFRFLDESATTRKTYYKVLVVPGKMKAEANRIEVESSRDGIEFKAERDKNTRGVTLDKRTIVEGIRVAGLGLVEEGSVDLFFNPVYGAEPFSLHISQSGSLFTIEYNPYSGRVRIVEGRI